MRTDPALAPATRTSTELEAGSGARRNSLPTGRPVHAPAVGGVQEILPSVDVPDLAVDHQLPSVVVEDGDRARGGAGIVLVQADLDLRTSRREHRDDGVGR